MSNQVYFRLNHDADRFTNGVTYSIHDPGGPAVGEVLSLDEPDAVGDFVITKMQAANAEAATQQEVPLFLTAARKSSFAWMRQFLKATLESRVKLAEEKQPNLFLVCR